MSLQTLFSEHNLKKEKCGFSFMWQTKFRAVVKKFKLPKHDMQILSIHLGSKGSATQPRRREVAFVVEAKVLVPHRNGSLLCSPLHGLADTRPISGELNLPPRVAAISFLIFQTFLLPWISRLLVAGSEHSSFCWYPCECSTGYKQGFVNSGE